MSLRSTFRRLTLITPTSTAWTRFRTNTPTHSAHLCLRTLSPAAAARVLPSICSPLSVRTFSSSQSSSSTLPDSNDPTEIDGGAAFQHRDDPNANLNSSFRRTSASGILAPRSKGASSGSRVDDPSALSIEALKQIQQFNITAKKDESVPVGDPSKARQRVKPQKGGRAIGPAEVVEQQGRLTPMQIHRILATLQQKDTKWTIEAIAAAYEIDVNQLEAIQKHLILPFVFKDDEGVWQGMTTEPTHITIEKALGINKELPILGHHLPITDKKLS